MRSKRSRASVVGRSVPLRAATGSSTTLTPPPVSRRVSKGAERAVPTRNGRAANYIWARFALPTLRGCSCRLQHRAQELAGALVLRGAEQLFGRALLGDFASIEETHPVGEF